MRLTVSNIAWAQHDDPRVFDTLLDHGVCGIEIAPTKVWPDWSGATRKSAAAYRRRLENVGFSVPAMQAILFGRPDLNLFAAPAGFRRLRDHLHRVSELAAALGARIIVFGSPRNRDVGALDADAAFARACEAFAVLGADCAELDVCLCIEPNPAAYDCNFITTTSQAVRLVTTVSSPGFGLHLDSGGMFLEQEDAVQAIRASASLVRHFHASEPHLAGFEAPRVDHAAVGAALHDIGYDGWVSIEMRAVPGERRAIAAACTLVSRDYATALSAPS